MEIFASFKANTWQSLVPVTVLEPLNNFGSLIQLI